MKTIGTQLLLLSLASFLFAGCIFSDMETGRAGVSVTLSLRVDVTNLPVCTPSTRAYEDPESDGEKMQNPADHHCQTGRNDRTQQIH